MSESGDDQKRVTLRMVPLPDLLHCQENGRKQVDTLLQFLKLKVELEERVVHDLSRAARQPLDKVAFPEDTTLNMALSQLRVYMQHRSQDQQHFATAFETQVRRPLMTVQQESRVRQQQLKNSVQKAVKAAALNQSQLSRIREALHEAERVLEVEQAKRGAAAATATSAGNDVAGGSRPKMSAASSISAGAAKTDVNASNRNQNSTAGLAAPKEARSWSSRWFSSSSSSGSSLPKPKPFPPATTTLTVPSVDTATTHTSEQEHRSIAAETGDGGHRGNKNSSTSPRHPSMEHDENSRQQAEQEDANDDQSQTQVAPAINAKGTRQDNGSDGSRTDESSFKKKPKPLPPPKTSLGQSTGIANTTPQSMDDTPASLPQPPPPLNPPPAHTRMGAKTTRNGQVVYSQAHAPSKHEERVRLLEQHSHDSKASLLRLFATRDSAIEEAAEQAQDIETRRFQSAKLCLERFVNLERQHVNERAKALDLLEEAVRGVAVEADLGRVEGLLRDPERTRGYSRALQLLDWDWKRITMQRDQEERNHQQKGKDPQQEQDQERTPQQQPAEGLGDEMGTSPAHANHQPPKSQDHNGGKEQASAARGTLELLLRRLIFGDDSSSSSSSGGGGSAELELLASSEDFKAMAAELVKHCADRDERARVLQIMQEGRSGEVEIIADGNNEQEKDEDEDEKITMKEKETEIQGGNNNVDTQNAGIVTKKKLWMAPLSWCGVRFKAVCAFFWGVLDHCEAQKDGAHAKQLMILSDTVYCIAPEHKQGLSQSRARCEHGKRQDIQCYVQEALKKHGLWSHRWFWEDMMLTGVTEQFNLNPLERPWEDLSFSTTRFSTDALTSRAASMTTGSSASGGSSAASAARSSRSRAPSAGMSSGSEPDELHDAVLLVHNTVYAQLAAIVSNMSQFGRSDAEIADFLEKMCRRSQLAEYQVGSLKALLQEKSAKEAKKSEVEKGGVSTSADGIGKERKDADSEEEQNSGKATSGIDLL